MEIRRVKARINKKIVETIGIIKTLSIMNNNVLLQNIIRAFIEQDKYIFDKHVPEFIIDEKFLGDYFNQLAVELHGSNPPRFYHTFSPFDVISNKAPHHAVVFEDGKLILNTEFDKYVAMRTAAMSAIVLSALGTQSLTNKRVLLFGTGNIATECVKILNSELQLSTIDVINKSGDLSDFEYKLSDLEVKIENGNLDNIGEYDVIICHTQTTEPLITSDDIDRLKKGALVTSFISSSESGELPDEIYNSKVANVVTDWAQTTLGAKELSRAIESKRINEEDIVYLKDLLTTKNLIDNDKNYTVYRSTGTPIQNIAVLKEIIRK